MRVDEVGALIYLYAKLPLRARTYICSAFANASVGSCNCSTEKNEKIKKKARDDTVAH